MSRLHDFTRKTLSLAALSSACLAAIPAQAGLLGGAGGNIGGTLGGTLGGALNGGFSSPLNGGIAPAMPTLPAQGINGQAQGSAFGNGAITLSPGLRSTLDGASGATADAAGNASGTAQGAAQGTAQGAAKGTAGATKSATAAAQGQGQGQAQGQAGSTATTSRPVGGAAGGDGRYGVGGSITKAVSMNASASMSGEAGASN